MCSQGSTPVINPWSFNQANTYWRIPKARRQLLQPTNNSPWSFELDSVGCICPRRESTNISDFTKSTTISTPPGFWANGLPYGIPNPWTTLVFQPPSKRLTQHQVLSPVFHTWREISLQKLLYKINSQILMATYFGIRFSQGINNLWVTLVGRSHLRK